RSRGDSALVRARPPPILSRVCAVEAGGISMPSTSVPMRKPLAEEAWYHGKLSRQEAESRLADSGDFLVRESCSSPGQYVLSGLQGDTAKHLLLVDPEGMRNWY
uniref:SH2 domain-containing protein n=1 Tax=Denticeps clupeoides TaxID=299321 RepID=A0AAY4ELR0_9TELE